jgi:serine/threonine-protein kinase HipA
MKELTVTYRGLGEDVVLGTLAEDGSDVLFQYSAAAIAQGLELSPIRLPLRAAAYPDQRAQYEHLQQVPGLLYDSLPDSWGFRLMNMRMRARGIDPTHATTLDRLAYLGDNTMGALVYTPGTEDLTEGKDLSLMALAAEVQALLVDESHDVLVELARVGGSPGGARPKALVYFNPATNQMCTQDGHAEGVEPWLVKFPASDDEADSCALEELYAQVAHRCDMGMAPTRFFELNKGLSAFGTKRFDRRGAQRVHVHSLAGLLHTNFQIPSLNYEDFFKATRRLTRDNRELRNAVKRCVYNVLMNNRDDHSKNFAFRLEAENTWRLAPPYDLTYCPGYRGEHFMDVAGEGKAPGRTHIIAAAKAAGLGVKDTAVLIDELLDCATPASLKTMAKELPIRTKTLTTVFKAIEENRKRLA